MPAAFIHDAEVLEALGFVGLHRVAAVAAGEVEFAAEIEHGAVDAGVGVDVGRSRSRADSAHVVAVGVFEDLDFVRPFDAIEFLVAASPEAVIQDFGDPDPSARVDVDGDGVGDHRLAGPEGGFEPFGRLEFPGRFLERDLCRGIGGPGQHERAGPERPRQSVLGSVGRGLKDERRSAIRSADRRRLTNDGGLSGDRPEDVLPIVPGRSRLVQRAAGTENRSGGK